MELNVRNVNEALYLGALVFSKPGSRIQSISPRNEQETLEYAGLWVTTYAQPDERVLFSHARDANPFFHFMEGLWMLAGRNDVKWISRFNGNIATFSDDGVRFNAAYGHRLRNHFGIDQLQNVIRLLRTEPSTRRATCVLFDPKQDYLSTKDVPCNDMVAFKIRNGRLNMRVYNRSNDMIWGAYGANAVHFSMIMEYVAAQTHVPLGEYSQVTDCMHVYVENKKWPGILNESHSGRLLSYDLYDTNKVAPMPMIVDINKWDYELHRFMDNPTGAFFEEPLFATVAQPMWQAWNAWKHKNIDKALEFAHNIAASDWKRACVAWLERRVKIA